MKKFSYLLNVLLVGFIGFQSFKKSETIKPHQSNCDSICMNYSNVPQFKMNSNVLKMMSANYSYGNAPVNHNTANDAKSVWFSLTTLKTFIWQIENQVCKRSNNCAKKDSLGIRIYYARYPQNVIASGSSMLWSQYPNDLGNLPNNYQKQHTFFMVPTFNIGGVHADFDPFSAAYNNCKPKTLKDMFGTYKMTKESTKILSTIASMGITALTPDPDPSAKNHGELCPPYPSGQTSCPGAYFQ